MLTFVLALAIQAVPAAADVTSDSDTIVVTATRESLLRALERCKAGGCTPRQDIVASIRYAEVLFKSGDYIRARQTLQDAIARDKHAAPEEPIAVAALYEATANVALHDGDQDVVRRAGAARVAVMRDNMVGADAATLMAALENGDQMITTDRLDAAESRYRAVAARARELNLPVVHAAATMRVALAAHVDRRESDARRLLEGLLADDRLNDTSKLSVRAMLARFARDRGDKQATDALIASYKANPVPIGREGPMLLWQPALLQPSEGNGVGPFNIYDQSGGRGAVAHPGWADIGFSIKDDGTVSSPEILRSSGKVTWSDPILKTIAGRRYTPSTAVGTELYRIERWSLVLDYAVPGDSSIRRRAVRPHFVKTDLTPESVNIAKS